MLNPFNKVILNADCENKLEDLNDGETMRFGKISAIFILLWISTFILFVNFGERLHGYDKYYPAIVLTSPPLGVVCGFIGYMSDKKKWLAIAATLVNFLGAIFFFIILPKMNQ